MYRDPALAGEESRMDRRQFVQSVLALPLAWTSPGWADEPFFVGDMHAHFFFRDGQHKTTPIGETMANGRAALVAWAISGDTLWIGEQKGRGYVQKSEPKPGETYGWFMRELQRIKKQLARQNLKIVRNKQDVERALKGEPHVVLAVEGANFIEGDIDRLRIAYEFGIRHLQLVYYSRNSLGDFQTEKPEHGGLTDLGKQVVRECNRLGILIDLAHATSNGVAQALALSRVPMVWSHGSVTTGNPRWDMIGWRARQLTFPDAKAIAGKGGVVGLWALKQDIGRSLDDYAGRLNGLAELIGEDHAAIGSDLNGLGSSSLVNEFADLQTVVEHWRKRGVSTARMRKLAIGNYARVLSQAIG
jgi:membrane dipeptidase